jgi:hypothetical protein
LLCNVPSVGRATVAAIATARNVGPSRTPLSNNHEYTAIQSTYRERGAPCRGGGNATVSVLERTAAVRKLSLGKDCQIATLTLDALRYPHGSVRVSLNAQIYGLSRRTTFLSRSKPPRLRTFIPKFGLAAMTTAKPSGG